MKTHMIKFCSLLFILIFIFQTNFFAQKRTILKNVNIIDGKGNPAYKSDILIKGNLIDQIGQNINAKDATAIDLSGKTIMPSLISSHVHIGLIHDTTNSPSNYTRDNILHQLKQYQDFGISNILTMGTDRPILFQSGLLDSIQKGKLPVASMLSAGYGFGVPNAAPPKAMGMDLVFRPNNPNEIKREMDSLQKIHPFVIKIWVDDFGGKFKKMSPEIYKEIIIEAHKKNIKVAAHVYYLKDLKQLIHDGLDIVAHSIRDTLIDDQTIQLMKKKKITYIPTLSLDEYAYIYARKPEWINDAFFKASLEPGVYEMITSTSYQEKIKNQPSHAKDIKAFETALQNVKKLYDAGILIALGTDSGALPIRAQGFSEHLELELLTQAGLTPLQAIQVGTENAAKVLHIDKKQGTIEKGKIANFILLNSDPTNNIKNTRDIQTIWRNGQVVSHGPIHS